MAAVLIDTDILIDCLRGKSEASSFIEGQAAVPYLSAVTVAKLYAGVFDEERDDLAAILAANRAALKG